MQHLLIPTLKKKLAEGRRTSWNETEIEKKQAIIFIEKWTVRGNKRNGITAILSSSLSN
jgi:hypothetical protein